MKQDSVNQSEILLNHLRSFPFVLAPMASITNAPFRLVMKELGAGVVISELISATGIQYGGQKTLDLCHYEEGERPVGLQIFGEEGPVLAQAAAFLERRGVDFVDINLGCPVPKVVKKGGGSAMMKDPEKLAEVLKEVVAAIAIPLTIKIRTGWDACSRNALECIHAAAEAGVTWVAIHGRTRAQGYEGAADWDFIADLASKSPLPLIGNGDVLTASQAMDRLNSSRVAGVMIGRGALRNPFVFREIRSLWGRGAEALSEGNQLHTLWDVIQRQDVLLARTSNLFHRGVQLRKFMTWYSAGFEGSSAFRKALYAVPTSEDPRSHDEILALGRGFFENPQLRRSQSYLAEPFLQGGHG